MSHRSAAHWVAVLAVLGSSLASGCQHHRDRLLLGESGAGGCGGMSAHGDYAGASVGCSQLELPQVQPPRTPTGPQPTETLELSLHDAVRMALENSEVVRVLVGSEAALTGTTRFDPLITQREIAIALARFDTRADVSMFWSRRDQPPGSAFVFNPAAGSFDLASLQQDEATIRASLSKTLVTGGEASIAYNPMPQGYLLTSPLTFSGVLNPIHRANLEFAVRQPLLKGAGIEFNRAPITVARLNTDQSLWQLKEALLAQVRSVATAYWNLQAAQASLQAIDRVVPLAAEIVRVQQSRVETGKAIQADLNRSEVQLERFDQERTRAAANVIEQERQLRNLIGLPANDTLAIVATDSPTNAPLQLDWSATVATAVERRPDLVRQRLAVRVRELQYLIACNAVQPQLDVFGLWRVNGLADELGDALEILGDNQFTDWELGVSFSMPLGLRAETAREEAAELARRREVSVLREKVEQTLHDLSVVVTELDALYAEYQCASRREKAAKSWEEGARVRFESPLRVAQGQDALLLALIDYQDSLAAAALATSEAARLLARYNSELARLEELKGTLLDGSDIQLLEDPSLLVRPR